MENGDPRPSLHQITKSLGQGEISVELLSAHRFEHTLAKGQLGHKVPYSSMQLIQKGLTRYRIGAQRVTCRPGDAVLMAAGVSHDYHHDRGTQGLFLSFDIHHLGPISFDKPCLHLSQAWNLVPIAKSLMLERRRESPYQTLRVRSLFCLLFSSMLLLQNTHNHKTRPLSDSQAENILAILSQGKHGATSSMKLADALHLSRPYFTRVFRQTFGVSLRVFQMRERLRQAALVLSRENLTVAEVAAQFGYSSIPSFCRQYVKLFGESPGRHRGG